MQSNNQLSNFLSKKELNYKYDNAVKRLLSFKAVLAHILKGCVWEYKDTDPNEIEELIEGEPIISDKPVNREINAHNTPVVEGMRNEDTSGDEGTVVYDILFYAYTPDKQKKIKLIINIEAQNSFNPGYPILKRGLYYCSRLISAQYGTEFRTGEYGKIKKVISIWICFNPPKNKGNTLTRFSIKPKQLIGKAHYDLQNYDLLDLVMVCIDKDAFSANHPPDDNLKEVIRFLTILITNNLKSEMKKAMLESEYNMKFTEEINEEVLKVCNLSYGIAEENYLKGITVGETRGKAEGKAEGKALNLIANVKMLMQNLNFTIEKALEVLGITPEEYKNCLAIAEQSNNLI